MSLKKPLKHVLVLSRPQTRLVGSFSILSYSNVTKMCLLQCDIVSTPGRRYRLSRLLLRPRCHPQGCNASRLHFQPRQWPYRDPQIGFVSCQHAKLRLKCSRYHLKKTPILSADACLKKQYGKKRKKQKQNQFRRFFASLRKKACETNDKMLKRLALVP